VNLAQRDVVVFEIYDALEARERGSKRERLNAWVILVDPGQIEIVLIRQAMRDLAHELVLRVDLGGSKREISYDSR
jgi:hypothetical protein